MGLFGSLIKKTIKAEIKKAVKPSSLNKKEKERSKPNNQTAIPGKSSTSLPDIASGNFYVAYQYDDLKFFPPYEIVSKVKRELRPVGSDVILVTEPTNEHDDRAVALYVHGNKIGYILRGTVQDMIHDYFDQNLPIKATLNSLKRIDGEYQGYITLTFYRHGSNPRRLGYRDIDIKSIKPTNSDVTADTPLAGKNVVFCGYFNLPLEEMMQKAVDAGAVLRKVVTKTVDYLVMGKNNGEFLDENGMTSKERTARKLIAEGHNIQIVDEKEFLQLAKTDTRPSVDTTLEEATKRAPVKEVVFPEHKEELGINK